MARQATFGARLKAAREARGISLRDVATTTKISMSALEALEHDDPSRLPGGIFSRAFVRSYAYEVGLDPEAAVREFADTFPDSVQPLRDVAALAPQERPASGASWGGPLTALVLVLAAVAGTLMMGWPRLPFARAPEVAVAEPAADPATTRAALGPAQAAQPPHAETSDGAVETPLAPVAASRPVEEGEARRPVFDEGGPIRLSVHPVARCWVRVVIDGRVVISRELGPGEREVLDADSEIVLTVGDAGAFAFSLNDAPGRPLGGPGKVVTIRIQRGNLTDFVAS